LSISAAPTSVTRVCSVCGESYLQGTAHSCLKGGASLADGDDLLGAILGERYRILGHLNKGGMGVIYKAQHTVLDKPLAIKVMLQAQDDAARQRFLQEAKLASLVRHPNIVDIIDFGVLTSKQPYLVMELLVGKTLADLILDGALSPLRACHIAAQIARGLHAVHQKGIIHRDLKPAEVLPVESRA
jgi:serine/threonine-protein kinase